MSADFSSIQFRPAVDSDKPFLLDLRKQTMTQHLERAGVDAHEEAHMDRVEYEFSSSQLLLKDMQPVGMLKVKMSADMWTIIQIQLAPQWQCRGMGASVIRRVTSDAAALGVKVELSVLKGNPAKLLYERLGFSVIQEDERTSLMRCSCSKLAKLHP